MFYFAANVKEKIEKAAIRSEQIDTRPYIARGLSVDDYEIISSKKLFEITDFVAEKKAKALLNEKKQNIVLNQG